MITTSRTRKSSNNYLRETEGSGSDCTVTAAISAQKLLLTFSRPVVLRGLPTLITVNDAPPTVAQQTSPTTILLTYAAPVASGQTWLIPNRVAQLRTSTGGFVAAATATFPN